MSPAWRLKKENALPIRVLAFWVHPLRDLSAFFLAGFFFMNSPPFYGGFAEPRKSPKVFVTATDPASGPPAHRGASLSHWLVYGVEVTRKESWSLPYRLRLYLWSIPLRNLLPRCTLYFFDEDRGL
ncbi:hypothetical protein MPNT_50006 [Candidatus Methylacidithermus pantelleriae]|uniref:Uncharacterized protein n=1 Tax=Candidatus Methylacidithermus pantelleriae TaxID=2744239 RepID=A0A8J2FT14_9BACT|nr:hypothetical protein MPNT_50006 [Candidatus Methylacidithermus pantelleriae]